VKQIPLTRGQFALVDDEDYKHLIQHKWCALFYKCVNSFYAMQALPRNGEKQKIISMHRVIMGVTDSKIQVDHIDHDTLNNQRSNLRICNHSESMANRRPFKNGSSKYFGVHWHKKTGKWQVQIQKDKKLKYIGIFATQEDAAKAYNEIAIKTHGEFANLNSIPC
jgi:hypothetical protein